MKNLASFLSLLVGILSFAQLSETKNKLIQPLTKIDYAESSSVGYDGGPSKIFESFEKIKNSLNNDDLLILSKNSSNALRLYSCFELIKRNETRMVSIYEYYKQFPLKMRYTQGCVGIISDFSEMIFNEYQSKFNINEYAANQLKELTKSDPAYKELEKALTINKKLIENPDFIEAFERIKIIKAKFDNNK